MIKFNGEQGIYSLTPNQTAKLFVHQWGAEAKERWVNEYENYSVLHDDEINRINQYIDKHIDRILKFLSRKHISTNKSNKIDRRLSLNHFLNQTSKLFVHQWGIEAKERWVNEYENYQELNDDEVSIIDAYIEKHIARIGKFLSRKYKNPNDVNKTS